MANIINKPRGTSDFFNNDKKLFDSIANELDASASQFGCSKADGPMFEEVGLFVRGVGESSDIVSKEMFKLSVKGEHDYVLRPEFTASINRAVIENKFFASPDLPLKISYCGPVFRYERPQKGRYREFNQWGVEFIDQKIDLNTALDCVLLLYRSVEKLLGRELLLKINYLGSFEARKNYGAALKDYYASKLDNMCEDCHHRFETNVLRILDCKVHEDIEINKNAPFIADYLLPEDQKSFAMIKSTLSSLGVPFKEEPRLVRGLDYYTGLVFELYDPMNMELGAIGAGGQYGKLMEEIGGPAFEGIGFSIGMERIMLSLNDDKKNELISNVTPSLDYFVIDLRKEKDTFPLLLEDSLRSSGRNVSAPSYSKALNGSLKMADRLHAKTCLIFDDYNPGQIIVKNMADRSQINIDADDPDIVLGKLISKEK